MKLARTMLGLLAVLGALLGFILGCGGAPGAREAAEGLAELQKGNYTRATVLLEKSITLRPASEENAMIFNYLGLAAHRVGQVDRAVEQFEESRKRNPRLFEPAYNLGILMLEGGDTDRAQAMFEQATLADPRDTRALEYLGGLFLQKKEWAEARRVYYQALERTPNAPSLLTGIALAELRIVGTAAAENNLMRALEADSDYAPALYNLGIIYQQSAQSPEKSAGYLEKYLAVAPQDANAALARKVLGDLQPLLARAAAEAEREKESTPPVTPLPAPGAPPATFEEKLKAARAAAEKGDPATALRYCREAAASAQRNNDLKSQEKAMTLAVYLCARQPEAHLELGRFQLEQGRYQDAVASFKQALALKPGWSAAYLGQAAASTETREFDAALVTLKEGLRTEPENPDLLWALAELYDRNMGLPEQAARAYRDFERLCPGDPRIVKARERSAKLLPPLPVEKPIGKPPKPAPAPARTPDERAGPSAPAGPAKPEKAAPDPFARGRKLEIPPTPLRNMRAAVQAYNRGTIYQERDDWERAVYYYSNALQNDDQFLNAFYNLGTVYRAQGELDLAADAFRRALKLEPKMVSARYNLALIFIHADALEAAREQLTEILRAQSNYPPAYYALGLIYARNPATVEAARRNYRKFLELAPSDPAAAAVKEWLRSH